MKDEQTAESPARPPNTPLDDEQRDYVEQALRSGTMSMGEITVVLALAEIRELKPLEMQHRWLDYKMGIVQVQREVARNLGIITT